MPSLTKAIATISDTSKSQWIVACAAIVVALLATVSATYRISRPYPLTPWESAIVADAFRLARGESVYADPETDHATHMYGPLITLATSGISRLTGTSLQPARWIALLSTIGTCIALTVALARNSGWATRLIAFGSLSGCFFVSRAAYAESRPDAVSVFLAAMALITFYRGAHARCWYRITAAILGLFIAALFKQTAFVFVFVPAIAWIAMKAVRLPPSPNMRFLLVASGLTIAAAGGAVMVLRIGFPQVWMYVVEVPARFSIDFSKLPRAAGLLVLFSIFPLFLIVSSTSALVARLRGGHMREIWLVAAIVVTVPASLAAFIKSGGGENSLLPALLACTALAITLLLGSARRLVPALTCAILLVVQTIAWPRAIAWAFHARHGDATYAQIVRSTDPVLQHAICPDDPTIPLLLRAQPGRSLDCELDYIAQRGFPRYLVRHIRSASFVIRVHGTWDAHITEVQMRAWGFERMQHPLFVTGMYSLWRNADADGP